MYGQHMAHIRLLIYCFVLAVSSFSCAGFMQHMFSPITHITEAIEDYLVSDTSSTLCLREGALSTRKPFLPPQKH